MAIKVKIPLQIQQFSGNKPELEVTPAGPISFKHLFDELEKANPCLKANIFGKDGNPKRFMSVFINGKDYRNLRGSLTELVDGDIVTISTAVVEG
jgi:sulfur-carrier protein